MWLLRMWYMSYVVKPPRYAPLGCLVERVKRGRAYESLIYPCRVRREEDKRRVKKKRQAGSLSSTPARTFGLQCCLIGLSPVFLPNHIWRSTRRRHFELGEDGNLPPASPLSWCPFPFLPSDTSFVKTGYCNSREGRMECPLRHTSMK
jgi:hypothetical protein